MLILPNANGLGVNFYQLCQRVLEPPGNGHSGAEVYIIVGELLRSQGRGGIDGGSGFIDNGIAGIRECTEHLHCHGFSLPGGGAVADGDMLYPVLPHQCGQGGDCLLLFALAECGVDHGSIQHLASGVYHSYLAAVAVSGIQSHGDKAFYRGLHQQRLQVQRKIVDGALAGTVGQLVADFPGNRGENQSLIGIFGCCTNKQRNIPLWL